MQPPSSPTHDIPAPTSPNQQAADPVVLREFRPTNLPLRERGLKQTTIKIVLLLTTGIVCAAVMVWFFLPSQLPWLP